MGTSFLAMMVAASAMGPDGVFLVLACSPLCCVDAPFVVSAALVLSALLPCLHDSKVPVKNMMAGSINLFIKYAYYFGGEISE